MTTSNNHDSETDPGAAIIQHEPAAEVIPREGDPHGRIAMALMLLLMLLLVFVVIAIAQSVA